MPNIDVDDEVALFLIRFRNVNPNTALRLLLGIERRADCEHSSDQFHGTIIQLLSEAGGSLELEELYRRVEKSGILGPGDYRAAEQHWQNKMRYAAEKLRNDGKLKRGSPRGIWELEH